jgi:hypothetical protein
MKNTITVNIPTILENCPIIETSDSGVKVISLCAFAEAIWPDFFEDTKRWYDRDNALTKLIEKYAGNLFHFYGEPKESFFIWEAIEQADKKGLKVVIVENMS